MSPLKFVRYKHQILIHEILSLFLSKKDSDIRDVCRVMFDGCTRVPWTIGTEYSKAVDSRRPQASKDESLWIERFRSIASQSSKGKIEKSPTGHRFQIPNLFSPLLCFHPVRKPPPYISSSPRIRRLAAAYKAVFLSPSPPESSKGRSQVSQPPEFDVRLYPMDPHRLNSPAADDDTVDTEDWGNITAQFSCSFDFLVSMLTF